MLGFNKYVIPFQRESEKLPFNVAGLDTIKYSQTNFKDKAMKAIQRTIEQTTPKSDSNLPVDRIVEKFLLIQDAFLCPIDDVGNKNIYDLGSPFGYFLLNNFSGMKYYFLGVFTMLSLNQIKWRLNKLEQVIKARFSKETLLQRMELGIVDKQGIVVALKILELLSGWIIVQTETEKTTVQEYSKNLELPFEIFSLEEIIENLNSAGL